MGEWCHCTACNRRIASGTSEWLTGRMGRSHAEGQLTDHCVYHTGASKLNQEVKPFKHGSNQNKNFIARSVDDAEKLVIQELLTSARAFHSPQPTAVCPFISLYNSSSSLHDFHVEIKQEIEKEGCMAHCAKFL